jgi:hypothetical protein
VRAGSTWRGCGLREEGGTWEDSPGDRAAASQRLGRGVAGWHRPEELQRGGEWKSGRGRPRSVRHRGTEENREQREEFAAFSSQCDDRKKRN